MCWQYEDNYSGCFDHFTEDLGLERSVPWLLEESYGVKVVDGSRLRDLIEALLSTAHEEGIIRPKEKKEEK